MRFDWFSALVLPHLMSRIQTVLYFVIYLSLGLWLFILPWMPVWEKNFFVVHYVLFSSIIRNDFVRGAVSGLGLVDIFIAFYGLRPRRKNDGR